MHQFYVGEPPAMAANALDLATRRGLTHDRAGLLALARQILDKAESSPQMTADDVLCDAQGQFDGDQWEYNDPNADRVDPITAIVQEPIHADTLDEAMQVLDGTSEPGAPKNPNDYPDLVRLLHGVFWALYLPLYIDPCKVLSELSDGRVTSPDGVSTPFLHEPTTRTVFRAGSPV